MTSHQLIGGNLALKLRATVSVENGFRATKRLIVRGTWIHVSCIRSLQTEAARCVHRVGLTCPPRICSPRFAALARSCVGWNSRVGHAQPQKLDHEGDQAALRRGRHRDPVPASDSLHRVGDRPLPRSYHGREGRAGTVGRPGFPAVRISGDASTRRSHAWARRYDPISASAASQ